MQENILLFTVMSTLYPGDNDGIADAKTSAERLKDAWAQLKKSKDTTAILITDIKRLSNEKIIYRTKLIERVDTVWRIDTCISVITAVDSATIAIMFKNREIPKKTGIGRAIQYIFVKKRKQ